MVMTACRRFVLPTPRSRWPIHDLLRRNASRKSSVADTIPFNHAAERGLRCVALGRKSRLSCGSDRGGRRAADMYGLIVTAKMNGVDPQEWLADVLSRIAGQPAHRLDELLPRNWPRPQAVAVLAA
jgi:hypothetical protein